MTDFERYANDAQIEDRRKKNVAAAEQRQLFWALQFFALLFILAWLVGGCTPATWGPAPQPFTPWSPVIYQRDPVVIYDYNAAEVARWSRTQRIENAVPGCCR